ncbi:MAG: hypothetical protein Q8R78_02325 [Candidatus Omnitrophota bacterium]|nr:hypothetical protein [Candidatus Omnitrophota bacterium]
MSAKKVLTLAVQDCHFTYDQLLAFLKKHSVPHSPLARSEVLLTTGFKWASPRATPRYRNCIHQNTLFRVLGFVEENIYAMDVNDYEGADIIHDLNQPVGDEWSSRFDLIFDGGTIEHVFSIKDALFNIARMCKVGGIVVDISPVDFINHGLVNLSAEVFRDFFVANGFDEVGLKYIAVPRHPRRAEQHYLEYRPDRFWYPLQPYYQTQVYSAFRKQVEKDLSVPMQGFYAKVWGGEQHAAGGEVMATSLRERLADWCDWYFVPSLLIRSFVQLRRGRKVVL